MFRRRRPLTFRQKMRNLFWPAMGWRRLGRYYRHRMGRLPGTPYYIAAGFASGIAVSLTPFMGLHIMLGVGICWLLRGSVVAMVLGTVLAGNPWTFPLIWIGTYHTGHWLMGHASVLNGRHLPGLEAPAALTWDLLVENPMEFLVPMTIGCLPFILPLWMAAFYGVRHIVGSYKEARAKDLHEAYVRRAGS